MKNYIYYVVYATKGGKGCSQVLVPRTIDSIDDLLGIADELKKKNGFDEVIILNFQLLRIEREHEMKLRKDDPIYYRNKLRDLLQEAQANGIRMEIENATRIYGSNPIKLCFCDTVNTDRVSLALTEYAEE